MSTDKPSSDKPVTSPRVTGQDRMTVSLRVVHERHGKDPHETGCRFDCSLTNSEQPVSREVEVGPDPVALPEFWLVGKVGTVVVHNPLPVYHRNPTVEQRATDMAKVVRVWMSPEVCSRPVVRPGGLPFVAAFDPEDVAGVRLSCESGPVKVLIDLLPA